MNRYPLLPGIAGLLALTLALAPPSARAQDETAPAAAEADSGEAGFAGATGDIVLGNEDAPVTMIEYASFTCPFCASFHLDTFPRIKAEYIDPGKVRFILREVYFDGEGLLAARMARCGGKKGYFDLVELYFASQDNWLRASSIPDALYRLAVRAGVPVERLKNCVLDREFALALVEDFQEHTARDGINATPTFLINGVRVEGGSGFEAISQAIEDALAQ